MQCLQFIHWAQARSSSAIKGPVIVLGLENDCCDRGPTLMVFTVFEFDFECKFESI